MEGDGYRNCPVGCAKLHDGVTTSLRTLSKPWRSRISQTASPETGRSLGNLDLNLRYQHLWPKASVQFCRISRLKEQRQRLYEICACIFDGVTMESAIPEFYSDEPEVRGTNVLIASGILPMCPVLVHCAGRGLL